MRREDKAGFQRATRFKERRGSRGLTSAGALNRCGFKGDGCDPFGRRLSCLFRRFIMYGDANADADGDCLTVDVRKRVDARYDNVGVPHLTSPLCAPCSRNRKLRAPSAQVPKNWRICAGGASGRPCFVSLVICDHIMLQTSDFEAVEAVELG